MPYGWIEKIQPHLKTYFNFNSTGPPVWPILLLRITFVEITYFTYKIIEYLVGP